MADIRKATEAGHCGGAFTVWIVEHEHRGGPWHETFDTEAEAIAYANEVEVEEVRALSQLADARRDRRENRHLTFADGRAAPRRPASDPQPIAHPAGKSTTPRVANRAIMDALRGVRTADATLDQTKPETR